MLVIKRNNANLILWIMFILISIQVTVTISAFTDVPPPPTRPERFHSREELKKYLHLVHEYYAIIGRPRFGRSSPVKRLNTNDRHLFNFFDRNGDESITFNEFRDQLENN